MVSIDLSLDAMAALLAKDQEHIYTFETLQDQIVWRDLCFVVDTGKDFGPVLNAVKTVAEVKDLEVFDVYQ